MHYIRVLSLLGLLATGAIADQCTHWQHNPPAKKGESPPQIPLVNQTNLCGNNVQPYCCNNYQGESTSCSTMGEIPAAFLDARHATFDRLLTASDEGSTCDTTIVCCNADDVSPCLSDPSPCWNGWLTATQAVEICIGSIDVTIINNITIEG
jgi:hypothetical protein